MSPAAVLLLAAFVLLSSPVLLAALLLAALCHELGHYEMLRRLGGWVSQVRISALGAQMQVAGRKLSYGGEMLTVAAGPAVNLVAAVLLSMLGIYWEILYLFAGAQLVLGVFNLLPIRPLDGGNLLWLLVARFTDPFTADRISAVIDLAAALPLLIGALILCRENSSPFLLLSVLGLLVCAARKKGLSKEDAKGKI